MHARSAQSRKMQLSKHKASNKDCVTAVTGHTLIPPHAGKCYTVLLPSPINQNIHDELASTQTTICFLGTHTGTAYNSRHVIEPGLVPGCIRWKQIYDRGSPRSLIPRCPQALTRTCAQLMLCPPSRGAGGGNDSSSSHSMGSFLGSIQCTTSTQFPPTTSCIRALAQSIHQSSLRSCPNLSKWLVPGQ